MTLAVAGDAKSVVPQLQAETTLKLPAPQMRDAEGQPVGRPRQRRGRIRYFTNDAASVNWK